MSSFPDEIICHILSFANFLDVISATMVSRTWANATKNGLNITKIDCGGREKLKDENLHNILKIWGKSLQEVDLHNCRKLTNKIGSFVHLCPSLACLNIKDCNRVGDRALYELVTKSPPIQLKSLIVSSNDSTNHRISGIYLQKFTKLVRLDIPNCLNVRTNALVQIATNLTQMIHLNLAGVPSVDGTVIECIADHMPMLQILNLSACHFRIDAVNYLAVRCVELRELNISGLFICGNSPLSIDMPNLEILNANRTVIAGITAKYPKIRELYLAWTNCPQLDILRLAQEANCLHTIDISGSDIELPVLKELFEACPSIESICVESCRSLPRSWRRNPLEQKLLSAQKCLEANLENSEDEFVVMQSHFKERSPKNIVDSQITSKEEDIRSIDQARSKRSRKANKIIQDYETTSKRKKRHMLANTDDELDDEWIPGMLLPEEEGYDYVIVHGKDGSIFLDKSSSSNSVLGNHSR